MTTDRSGRETDEQRDGAGEAAARDAGGGVSIGRLTGGAVASGHGSSAEDRSERIGSPPADDGPAGAPAVPPPGAGGISVGSMTGGAVAAGRESRAVDASRQLISASPELATAVRLLRAQLPLLTRSEDDGIDELDGELADVAGEIDRTGQAERGRLERLRALLTGGSAAVGGLASAFAVVQAIVQLLG
ncbi:hypothetical protein QMK19_11040 [Streptomyces sp. H10-C2]|uniref:hypothetical protein n=1 Tax=unclassified Streptomyces TaxID=2593676 RepID=UPI0024B9AA1F|nr:MULTISPECIES: hypothetical protein [unclassified Streptomyces]MDJ0340545.1 hypothetical protein [Streptomyces sp. PH10-H1]MDJ0370193.1 hypothetical protein [Streptomyces sp. H10-C2]